MTQRWKPVFRRPLAPVCCNPINSMTIPDEWDDDQVFPPLFSCYVDCHVADRKIQTLGQIENPLRFISHVPLG